MSRPKLTILTDPLPWGGDFLYEGLRRVARFVRGIIFSKRSYFNHPIYRGHFAVTRSLIEGLHKIGADFNYNPRFPWNLADTVIVLAGVRTLRQAIRLKQRGLIKKLYAGPNIVVFSGDNNSILAAPEVDAVITPCEWVINVYLEDNPSLKERIFSWPAGVDTLYWKPDSILRRKAILIFEKQNKGPVGPVGPYIDYLRAEGWEVQVIQYGTFNHHEYLDLLQQSCLMLGFVVCESQGIAWSEAWSTDVPTLIWRRTSNVFRGRHYKNSTAPYLAPQNGLFFNDLEDFKIQFKYWLTHREQFSPRKWILENMSDEVCAATLYQKVAQC